MDDKPEYRWLVGVASDYVITYRTILGSHGEITEEMAGSAARRILSEESGVHVFLIDLHKLEPVAVTGSDG